MILSQSQSVQYPLMMNIETITSDEARILQFPAKAPASAEVERWGGYLETPLFLRPDGSGRRVSSRQKKRDRPQGEIFKSSLESLPRT